ncbi:Protein alcS [Cytospora mali]|uniref:Protein alcS n=1 Tax=Cytospora mali TaxID=578113 RepID=A0A194UYK4_CYTMA|nr:Protein alcS [Valsa mali var. pyri (nom. inval.)]
MPTLTSPKISVQETGYDYQDDHDHRLHHSKTNGAVSISAELFEKLYLAPKTEVSGELRRTFGNPTPIGLVGFLIALTPLACDLMQWRGAGGSGATGIPQFFFFGGLLQFTAGLLEWVLGNTFPAAIFCTYAAFFLSFGSTLNPSFAAFSSFAPAGEDASTGLTTQAFNAGFGFFLVFMGLLSLIFLVCAFRTNVCFVIVFMALVFTFAFLTVAYWLLAEDYQGNAATANHFVIIGGGCAFVCCAAGWWILFALVLESVEFPFQLPVGDLSRLVKPRVHVPV